MSEVSNHFLNESLGDIIDVEKTSYGIKAKTEKEHLEVLFYSANIARIRTSRNSGFDDFSYSVIADPVTDACQFKEEDNQILLSSELFDIRISKSPGRLSFLTKDGQILNEEDPGLGTSWIGHEISTYRKLQEGERFIGLGEKTGHLDRRGSGYTHWNTDYFAYPLEGDPIYCSIPFYIGIHNGLCYGIFLDNSYKSHFNFGASNDRFSYFAVEGGDLNYYFIYGESIPEIIEQYTYLTGRMKMPPKWSLGYQQCRYSYYPDSEVKSIAKTFRDKQIPGDVIYLDIHYMEKFKVFTWDGERFADPKGMLDELKAQGFHVVVIIDPGVKVEEGYEAYEDGLKEDVFVKYPDGQNFTGEVWPGWCHFPDFTNPRVREWWGAKFADMVNVGIEGFWNDMNEFATWGNRLPDLMQFDHDGVPSTVKRVRNIYGLQMSRSTFEGTKKLMDDERPFILTRATFAGAQRYSAVWTGDNEASEDHMLLGVRIVNSLGLSGVSFCGPDVGGFAGTTYGDLFARWITIGAFTPFFRAHTFVNTNYSEPWAFGEEVEEISRNYINLRYRLMPYLYSVFYESSQTGMPLNRSLAMHYPHQVEVYDHRFENQFLFGPNILVAPIKSTETITKVYLPEGQWYDLHNDKLYQGDEIVYVDCPLTRLPLFVKAGGMLTMQSLVQNTSEAHDGVLYLHLYKGEDSAFQLYEDDGKTYSYETGIFNTYDVKWSQSKGIIKIEAIHQGIANSFKKVRLILHGFNGLTEAKVGTQRIALTEEEHSFFTPLTKFDPFAAGGEVEYSKVLVFETDLDNIEITL